MPLISRTQRSQYFQRGSDTRGLGPNTSPTKGFSLESGPRVPRSSGGDVNNSISQPESRRLDERLLVNKKVVKFFLQNEPSEIREPLSFDLKLKKYTKYSSLLTLPKRNWTDPHPSPEKLCRWTVVGTYANLQESSLRVPCYQNLHQCILRRATPPCVLFAIYEKLMKGSKNRYEVHFTLRNKRVETRFPSTLDTHPEPLDLILNKVDHRKFCDFRKIE